MIEILDLQLIYYQWLRLELVTVLYLYEHDKNYNKINSIITISKSNYTTSLTANSYTHGIEHNHLNYIIIIVSIFNPNMMDS